jgi:hypothetical protein
MLFALAAVIALSARPSLMYGLRCNETGFVVILDLEVDLTKFPPLTRLMSITKRCGNVQFQQITLADHLYAAKRVPVSTCS